MISLSCLLSAVMLVQFLRPLLPSLLPSRSNFSFILFAAILTALSHRVLFMLPYSSRSSPSPLERSLTFFLHHLRGSVVHTLTLMPSYSTISYLLYLSDSRVRTLFPAALYILSYFTVSHHMYLLIHPSLFFLFIFYCPLLFFVLIVFISSINWVS